MCGRRALARSQTYQATAAALAATGVLAGEATVVVYELEGGTVDGQAVSAALQLHRT